MGTVDLPKSPRASSSRKPASGRVQKLPANERLRQPVTQILEEETGNVIRCLEGRLSGEVLERFGFMDSLKEKLYNAIDLHYREIYKRYVSEDSDGIPFLTRHTSGEISELLRSLGGAGQFNTGEIEKSGKNTRNMNNLENFANNILRQKTGMGALLREDTAGSVVKCVFRDNVQKPKTVTDVKLSVNIPDSDLIDAEFYNHAATKYLIKDFICGHIIKNINKGINNSTDGEDPERLAESFLAEINPTSLDMSGIRENIRKSADIENIRTLGFNTAAVLLVSILDNLQMDYQFIENIKNGCELMIREYEEKDAACLPDEYYQIRLKYIGADQLIEDRKIYDAQTKNLENKIQHLWDLIEVIYQDSKNIFKVNDFEDLAKKNKNRTGLSDKTDKGLRELTGELSSLEDSNIRAMFARMYERIKNMYEFLYPVERRVMEERLVQLEKEYYRFDFVINPHHLQPGLLIDIDMKSIKRRKTTLDSVANALNEFFPGTLAAFQDAAVSVIGK